MFSDNSLSLVLALLGFSPLQFQPRMLPLRGGVRVQTGNQESLCVYSSALTLGELSSQSESLISVATAVDSNTDF